jgi:hypothetical protein
MTVRRDTSAGEVAPLELCQRRHARVEDRIRGANACGLRNFPFEDFVRNEAWLALVLIAQDLLAWTARVCLDCALAKAEPATLRYQLVHVGARVARRCGDLHLRIDSAGRGATPRLRLRPHARRPLRSGDAGPALAQIVHRGAQHDQLPELMVEPGRASVVTRRGRQRAAMRMVARRTNNRG